MQCDESQPNFKYENKFGFIFSSNFADQREIYVMYTLYIIFHLNEFYIIVYYTESTENFVFDFNT